MSASCTRGSVKSRAGSWLLAGSRCRPVNPPWPSPNAISGAVARIEQVGLVVAVEVEQPDLWVGQRKAGAGRAV